jgi:cholesterol transport system auxiliary component
MKRLWLVALCALAGCALTSKATPVEVHWYTPERVHPGAVSAPSNGPALILGFVRSGSDLGERIAWGDGAYQVGYYEDRRWTERPAQFVTAAVRRALFESRRFQPAGDLAAPKLDVELVSFQEVRTPRAHLGRVALHVQLVGDRVLLDATVNQDVPVAGDRFDDVVAAISRALGAVADEVAQRVQAAAATPASPGAGSGIQPPPTK